MKDIKISLKSDPSVQDTVFSFEGDITLEQAGKIISFMEETNKDIPTKYCKYSDCPKVKYSDCPVHGNKK